MWRLLGSTVLLATLAAVLANTLRAVEDRSHLLYTRLSDGREILTASTSRAHTVWSAARRTTLDIDDEVVSYFEGYFEDPPPGMPTWFSRTETSHRLIWRLDAASFTPTWIVGMCAYVLGLWGLGYVVARISVGTNSQLTSEEKTAAINGARNAALWSPLVASAMVVAVMLDVGIRCLYATPSSPGPAILRLAVLAVPLVVAAIGWHLTFRSDRTRRVLPWFRMVDFGGA